MTTVEELHAHGNQVRRDAADLMDRTAQWFVEHEWMRGDFANKDQTAACVVGALRINSGMEPFGFLARDETYLLAQWELKECVRKASKKHYVNLYDWNDSPNQRKDRVINRLRKCATALRKKVEREEKVLKEAKGDD